MEELRANEKNKNTGLGEGRMRKPAGRRESKQEGSHEVVYDLVSELTKHHFCQVPWSGRTNLK